MNMQRLLLIPLFLALLTGTASATIVLRVDVNDLTDLANVVVRGKVLSVDSQWTKDETSIHTLIQLSVTKVLKGKVSTQICVTCFGGRVGGDEVKVSGVPKFTVGEEVIVFLWRNARREYQVLGQNQGRFRIRKDEKTGEEKAENSLEGLAFVGPPDGKGGRRKVKRTLDSFPVKDLEKKVADRMEVLRKAEEARKAAEAAKKDEEAKLAAAEQKRKAEEGKNSPVVEPERATGDSPERATDKPVAPKPPVLPDPEKKKDPESEKADSK